MKRTRSRSWLAVLMLSVLLLLFASCASSPDPVVIPIDWPDFPAPEEVTLENGMARMPLTYWLAITQYVIKIETIREVLDGTETIGLGNQ